jgi:TonB family protein
VNHYEELGLSPTATEEEIRKAYRRAVKLVHPDQHMDPEMRSLAEKQLIRLNGIAEILLDADARSHYDFQLLGVLASYEPVADGTPWTPRTPRFSRKRARQRKMWLYGGTGIAAGLLLLFSWTDFSAGSDGRRPARTAARSSNEAKPGSSNASDAVLDEDPAISEDLARRLHAAYAADAGRDRSLGQDAVPGAEEATTAAPAAVRHRAQQQRSVLVVGLVAPHAANGDVPSMAPPPGEPMGASTDVFGADATGVRPSIPNGLGAAPPPLSKREAPVLIKRVQPKYPAMARSARVQGTVEFTALIGTDGLVRDLELVRGPNVLVDSAREAIAQWEYRPSMMNGVAIEAATRISIVFKLE